LKDLASGPELKFKADKGVAIESVTGSSPAYHARLRAGMVILKVGLVHVNTVAEFNAVMERQPRSGILFHVQSETGTRDYVLNAD
jgi:S1-C subfamily serine protease